MELALRFIVFRSKPEAELKDLGDIGEFLTEQATAFAEDKQFKYSDEAKVFSSTFKLLRDELGADAFRRFDATKKRFVGGFSVSAFEAVSLGVG